MIKKLVSLSRIGRLRSCVPVGDVEFRRLTLVYAENGHGKTTLSDTLKSLGSGDAALLVGRTTLGAPGSAQAEIRLDGATARFNNNAWSTTLPGIRVYDTRFVHENVYAGDTVSHEHKKGLYRVILGEEAVTRAHRIDELDEKIRDLTRQLGERERILSNVKPQGMSLDDFLALELRDSLSQDTVAAVRRVKALRNAQEIAEKSLPEPVAELPGLPSDFFGVMGRSIDDIAEDVDQRVRAHIANCLTEPDLAWLARGVELAASIDCPFCGQDLAGSALFPDLRIYFSEVYRQLKAEINVLSDTIQDFAGALQLERIARAVERNATLLDYWQGYVALGTIPNLDLAEVNSAAFRLRGLLLDLMQRKRLTPLEAISSPPGFEHAAEEYSGACRRLREYNQQIDQLRIMIEAKKRESASGNLAGEEATLERLQATAKRHEGDVAGFCESYLSLRRAKDEAVGEKQRVRVELDQHTSELLRRLESEINRFLQRFGAGFSIAEVDSRHVGGTPSANYRLIINNTPVDLGDSDTPASQPSFKNTLSAGDRSALAFAFFLASIFRDSQLSERIVVLDDPFTSQDRGRRLWTSSQIQRLAREAEQVIVLSHDPYFLRDVEENMPVDEVRTLQISHFGTRSQIQEYSPSDECLEAHAKDHKALLRYLDAGEGNPGEVRARLRPFIENYLYMRLPDQFPGNATLGTMIEAIRHADEGDPKAAAQGILEDLVAINDYSLGRHHRARGGRSEDTDTNELTVFVRCALLLVRGFESGSYPILGLDPATAMPGSA